MYMALDEEIRRILIFTGKPMHPEDIRRLVFDNRIYLRINSKQQSIKTFKRVMQDMTDVVTVYDHKSKSWKRRLKQQTREDYLLDLQTRAKKWLHVLSCKIVSLISGLNLKLKR